MEIIPHESDIVNWFWRLRVLEGRSALGVR